MTQMYIWIIVQIMLIRIFTIMLTLASFTEFKAKLPEISFPIIIFCQIISEALYKKFYPRNTLKARNYGK